MEQNTDIEVVNSIVNAVVGVDFKEERTTKWIEIKKMEHSCSRLEERSQMVPTSFAQDLSIKYSVPKTV